MPLRALAIVALLAAATAAAGGQTPAEPPMPYEQAVHPCPDGACQPGPWTARVPVVVRRDRGGPAAAYRLNAGAQVAPSEARLVTHRPGVVRFQRAATLRSGDQRITFRTGDLLYILAYHGEGMATAWFQGQIYPRLDGAIEIFNAACESNRDLCSGVVRERPQSELWVKVTDGRGRIGWTEQAARFAKPGTTLSPYFQSLRADVMRRLDRTCPGWELAPAGPRASQGMQTMAPNHLPNSIEGDFDNNGLKDTAVIIHTGPLNDPTARLVVFLDTGSGTIMHRATGPLLPSPLRQLLLVPKGSNGHDLDSNRSFKYAADAINLYSGEGAGSTLIFSGGIFRSIWSSD